MKKYIITSLHTVYVDKYNEGQLDQVNGYDLKSTIEATSIKEAIEIYFKDHLFYDLDIKSGEISEDGEFFYYSVLVDSENIQADKYEIEKWQRDEITLYSNEIVVFVQKLTDIKIKF